MIPFNIPPYLGIEDEYEEQVFKSRKLCGDGHFTKKCHRLLEASASVRHALLTTSCTHALEMSAFLADVRPGDEVIMPSYTFVSTANAFVLRGASVVFVDIRPDTMNINEKLIEDAVTPRTKAVVPVHYAGVSCEMDAILEIAGRHGLLVIEDAAQGVGSKYKGRTLGGIGDIGCYSFHETKNISCGEGGAILLQDDKFMERAEIIREKGTNRSKFWRGQVDKYTWCDIGSSYLPSELNAAYLYAQLENIEEINKDRMETWNFYFKELKSLKDDGAIDLPFAPNECEHNAHMFYIKVKDIEERSALIEFLKTKGIAAAFHYIPLHSSPAGRQYGRFHSVDKWTTQESGRLLRLPMYYGMEAQDRVRVIDAAHDFFKNKNG